MEAILASDFINRGNTAITLVVEGLLAHFFSPDRSSYSPKDVLWFLELANQQIQWCSKVYINQVEENVVEESPTKTSVSCFCCCKWHSTQLLISYHRITVGLEHFFFQSS